MMQYDEFLEELKIWSLEKVVYTRNLKPFQIHQKQIPPLISPIIAGDITFNTEHNKKSVYLKDGKSSEGKYNISQPKDFTAHPEHNEVRQIVNFVMKHHIIAKTEAS